MTSLVFAFSILCLNQCHMNGLVNYMFIDIDNFVICLYNFYVDEISALRDKGETWILILRY
jgi:hypothetical protein